MTKINSQISAKIIADSCNPFGNRITTFVLTFPRFILAELNTHRMLSRNSASSRAIPFEKMVKMVEEDPFIPIAWQKDHKGMQGTEYITSEPHLEQCKEDWLKARDNAINSAKELANGFPKLDAEFKQIGEEREDNVTKQLCNRLLEPFMWHTVIVTATEWDNFFALRCPQYEVYAGPEDTTEYLCRGRSWKDFMKSNNGLAGDFDTDNVIERLKLNKGQSEIHMMALAEAMWDAYNESTPKELRNGEWHIPFGDKLDKKEVDKFAWITNKKRNLSPLQTELAIATARCARVSYMNYEGTDDYEKDLKLYDQLATSGHFSPFEHCAKAMDEEQYRSNINGKINLINDKEFQTEFAAKTGYTPLSGACEKKALGWSGNFRGFIQLRKTLKGENGTNN